MRQSDAIQNSRSDERLAAPVNAVFSSHYAFLHRVWMQHRSSNFGKLQARARPAAAPSLLRRICY
ncbi:hypothetical protein LP417_13135 [Polaromonas sp. P1-6]|nr:hypothetical protein LP417_13135 [Polaromonas sp. P1-6]